MLILDHGLLRLVYVNQHRLDQHAWRSGQPAPHNIGALAQQGLRTVVNLRGARMCGSYLLEKNACERLGISLIDFKMRSSIAPAREELKAATELFQRIEYPMLLHCKSGADRAGLMSALYLFLGREVPLAVAKHQLSLRYGHLRRRSCGILDEFFDSYIDYNRANSMPFLEWIDKVYDPKDVEQSFRNRRRRWRKAAQPPEAAVPGIIGTSR